ncbi:hypothetical protein DRO32_02130, partial [Candidatus Bathyarchaeota archaeon]
MARPMRTSAIICLSASLVVSLPILVLLRTVVRFVAYAASSLIAFFIFLLVSQPDVLRRKRSVPRVGAFVALDSVFLASSTILLLSTLLAIDKLLSSLLSILLVFFMPGYIFLRLLRFPRENSSTSEILIFSLPYSTLLMAFTGLIVAVIPDKSAVARGLTSLSSVASAVILMLDVRTLRGRRGHLASDEIALSDVMAVSASGLVFSIMFSICYPKMARFPASDIMEHLRRAAVWLKVPSVYSAPSPCFHFPEAIAYLLSGYPGSMAFLTATALPSFMLFPSFYLLAKATFRGGDERLAPLSSLLLSCLSGFGWLFIPLKWGFGDLESYMSVQWQVYGKTYRDIPQGGAIDLYAWFRTRTLGFISLFLALWTLVEPGLSRREKVLNLALLSACLFLSHVSEFLVLIMALTLLLLFDGEFRGEFKNIFSAQLVSCGIIGAFDLSALALGQGGFLAREPLILLPVVLLLTAIAYLLSPFVQAACSKARGKLPDWLGLLILSAILVFIFSGVMAWLDQVDAFSMGAVSGGIGLLPWFFYPVHLGLAFILACIGLCRPGDVWGRGLKMALSVVLVALLTSRLISISNLYIIYTGFMEWRMPRYAFVASCIIASVGLRRIWDGMRPDGRRTPELLAALLGLGALILAGSMSTFYSMEEMSIWLSQARPIGPGDEKAIERLGELVLASPYTCVLTYTDASANIVRCAFPETIVEYWRYVIWASSSPELALSLLYDARVNELDGLYALYVHSRDLRAIRAFGASYMGYLISISEPYYSNEQVGVYVLPSFTPPIEGAPVVLLTPLNSSQAFVACSLLSFGHYYYDTALDVDLSAFSKQMVVLPMDYIPPALEALDPMGWLEAGGELLILSPLGLGPLSSYFLGPPSIFLQAPGQDVQIGTPAGGWSSTGLNLTGDVVEFSLENPWEENSPGVLAEDGQSSFWVPEAYGEGSIGAPVLYDDGDVKASGED